MIDYLQAGEIRRKYPEVLNRQYINTIINEWDIAGIERIDMLTHSAMFDPKTHRLNISEMELTLRADAHFNFKELEPIGSKKFHGLLAVIHFQNITGYRDPYEVEKETYTLRMTIGKEFLDKCKDLDAVELSEAFKTMREIHENVKQKYKSPTPLWEKRLDKLINQYIIKP